MRIRLIVPEPCYKVWFYANEEETIGNLKANIISELNLSFRSRYTSLVLEDAVLLPEHLVKNVLRDSDELYLKPNSTELESKSSKKRKTVEGGLLLENQDTVKKSEYERLHEKYKELKGKISKGSTKGNKENERLKKQIEESKKELTDRLKKQKEESKKELSKAVQRNELKEKELKKAIQSTSDLKEKLAHLAKEHEQACSKWAQAGKKEWQQEKKKMENKLEALKKEWEQERKHIQKEHKKNSKNLQNEIESLKSKGVVSMVTDTIDSMEQALEEEMQEEGEDPKNKYGRAMVTYSEVAPEHRLKKLNPHATKEHPIHRVPTLFYAENSVEKQPTQEAPVALPTKEATTVDYEACPKVDLQNTQISVGDRIAIKTLELTNNYTPEISDWKEATLVSLVLAEETLSVEFLPGFAKASTKGGKFDLKKKRYDENSYYYEEIEEEEEEEEEDRSAVFLFTDIFDIRQL
ncbi:hypothetical protein BY458DRAFT_555984 [Sporodiniella umbellata]|nr:hypothetical protein BY458DRAFT_555984 [Sporodiniella umbellata]